MTPEETANEMASTFHAKSQLPAVNRNEYTEIQHEGRVEQSGFLRVRVRTLLKLLQKSGRTFWHWPRPTPRTYRQQLCLRARPPRDLTRKEASRGRSLALVLAHALGPCDP